MGRSLGHLLTLIAGVAIGIVLAWRAGLPGGAEIQPPPTPITDAVDGRPGPSREPGAVAPAPRPPGSEPPGSLAAIMRLDGDFAQTAALYRLALAASAAEIERLLAEASAIARSSERQAASTILYQRYAELDPEAALDHMLAHEQGDRTLYLSSIFYPWARTDLEAALAAIELLDADERQVVGRAVLGARDDLSRGERRELARRLALTHVLGLLETEDDLGEIERDPAAAWNEALGARGIDADSRLARIAQIWALQDPRAALAASELVANPQVRGQLRWQITRVWSEEDPHAALTWVLTEPASETRAALLANATRALPPEEGIELANTLNAAEREVVLEGVLSRWADDDPRAAAEWLAGNGAEDRPGAIYQVAHQYAEENPTEALAWANGLAGREGAFAVQGVLQSLAMRDPQLAASLLNRIDDPDDRWHVATQVVGSWARQDPRAAADWVAASGTPERLGDLYAQVLGTWAQYDSDAAEAYRQTLPSVQARDLAALQIIRFGAGSIDYAETLYARIADQEQRRLAAEVLYERLRVDDPERAQQYRAAAQ